VTGFWELPGPHRFVAQVADDLRVGRSVVLAWPAHAPVRAASAIRAVLGELPYLLDST